MAHEQANASPRKSSTVLYLLKIQHVMSRVNSEAGITFKNKKTAMLSCKISRNSEGRMIYNKRTVILNVVKDLFANFSVGDACRLTDFSLRSRGSSSLRSE